MTASVVSPRGSAVQADAPARLEAVGIGYRLGSGRILHDVTLSVHAGHVTVLLGGRAAGKTCLVHVLAGLIEPTDGTVILGGVVRDAAALRASVGLVPSSGSSFYRSLSARENLVFFARLHGMRRGSARARADELLPWVGLRDVAHRPLRLYTPAMEKRL